MRMRVVCVKGSDHEGRSLISNLLPIFFNCLRAFTVLLAFITFVL